jgi:uncharacterized delta-60 repeat protein
MAIIRSFRSAAWLALPCAMALVGAAAQATVQRDLSYQGTGRVLVDFANEGDERSRGVAIDPTTGRAVFAGEVLSGGMKMGVARLNTDGSPDNSFSADGRTAIQPCTPGAFLNAIGGKNVAVQPDGKIVLVANCSAPDQIAVVRLLANGDPDNSFDGDGVALIANPTPAAGARGYGLALQSDGKILVSGGFGLNAGTSHAVVLRLNAGGSIDGTFATNGIYTSPLDHSLVVAVRTMADGRIVAGGQVNLPPADGRLNFVILRLTVSGTRDPQFNGGNELNFNVGGRSPADPSVMTQDRVNDLALRPDGTIVVAGHSDPPAGGGVPILAQFTVAGALDTNWGTGGYVVPSGGGSSGVAFALALRPTGDLLTTGRGFMVTHLSADGQDSSSLAFEDQGYTLALQGDGKFVAAVDQDAFSHEFLATRYLATLPAPDTTPDAFSFGAASNAALAIVVSAQTIIFGVSDPTPVSVTGGEYSVGCTATWNGPADADVIRNAESVCVRHTSSSSSTTAVSTTLTIGGVAATFTSTTGDLVPDAYTFVDQINVVKSTTIVSAGVTINGISLPTPVSVTGGEYSINCGATYTNVAGTVANGQAVCVRHVSSASGSTATTTTLTVGGVSDVFSTTTVADPPAPPPPGGGGGGGGGSLDLWLLLVLGLVVATSMRSRTPARER